ncbi:ribonuclease HI family protein [Alkaliphilus transvaalensis]|uniref:ribonuclease HI family protein n=1 Tax=Alkaliphilus transvaalensis TaxID=114628 RepID=UPI00047E9AB6|nr:ribonuclease HI family protein [Alkaliphilus transvaalensis]
MKAVMYSDGGSRGNPGEAGIGILLEDEQGEVIKEISQYIGKQTNNVAEYQALYKGLETALDLGVNDITCYLDSELVVKQIKGEYKVKNEGLIPIYQMVLPLTRKFQSFKIQHVRREHNKRADALANLAMDRKE